MKRIICSVLIICLLPIFALAEDFAAMSYEDLVALSHEITKEIMSRPEWKEVIVPGGTWIVGKDIPAGVYSIQPSDGGCLLQIKNNNDSLIANQTVRKPEESIGKIELLDGYIVNVSRGAALFAPPLSLGF